MIKRILATIIIVFILTLLALWQPWKALNFSWERLFGVEEIQPISGLQVFSLKGEMQVYVDEELVGTTEDTGEVLEVMNISPGNHTVKLMRISNAEDFYYTFSQNLLFVEGINTVIAYELGPSREFSQGHVFYGRKNSNLDENENTAFLNISSDVEDTRIFLNDREVGITPINDYDLDLTESYNVRMEKEGYESLSFTILPEDLEEREKLSGYDLFIEANLFLLPIEIEV